MTQRSRPRFARLETAYKEIKKTGPHMCSMTFPNTCAIRMSEALVSADMTSGSNKGIIEEFKKSGKNVCPHGYVRGAQELAEILRNIWGPRDLGWDAPGSAPKNILHKQGLICYMNIPGFGGSGHVDLWDRDRPVGEAYWKASPIWFWNLP